MSKTNHLIQYSPGRRVAFLGPNGLNVVHLTYDGEDANGRDGRATLHNHTDRGGFQIPDLTPEDAAELLAVTAKRIGEEQPRRRLDSTSILAGVLVLGMGFVGLSMAGHYGILPIGGSREAKVNDAAFEATLKTAEAIARDKLAMDLSVREAARRATETPAGGFVPRPATSGGQATTTVAPVDTSRGADPASPSTGTQATESTASTPSPASQAADGPPLVISGVELPPSAPTGIEGDGGANDPSARANVGDKLAIVKDTGPQPDVALPDGRAVQGSIGDRMEDVDQATRAAAAGAAAHMGRNDDLAANEANLEILKKAKAAIEAGEKMDPAFLAQLPPSIAARLIESGATLSQEETDAVQSNGTVKTVRLPGSEILRTSDKDGIPTVTDTNVWAGTNGNIMLPLPGGGDILSKEDFAAFGLEG